MNNLKFRKTSVVDKAIYITFFVIFVIFALICIYPLFWAIFKALKTMLEYSTNSLSLPQNPIFYHYVQIFTVFRSTGIDGTLYGYFPMLFNSLWILVVSVFVNVSSSALLAYALARFRFPGSKFLYAVVIFANTIPIIINQNSLIIN